MSDELRLSYIVPTAGRSPYLPACLEAFAGAHDQAEILLAVEDGADLSTAAVSPNLRVVSVPVGAGFAGGCNRAIAAADREFVALVNDDAIVDPDWAEALISVLDDNPQVGAIQGTNVRLHDAGTIDGCGIAWNRRWQAIQVDRGQRPRPDAPCREIFGVSGTAAVLRRQALNASSLGDAEFFDSALGSYYEDVELACRLRHAGYTSLHLPTVQAQHAGSTSSSGNAAWRWSQIYGNRILVLARLWGRRFPLHLPELIAGDLWDLAGACLKGNRSLIAGIARGWGRTFTRLSAFAQFGDPLLSMAELRRFQVFAMSERPT